MSARRDSPHAGGAPFSFWGERRPAWLAPCGRCWRRSKRRAVNKRRQMSYGSGMDGPPDAIAQAARALAAGHALLALKAVALRKDARGTALRGIALAQLGEYPRARALLRRATRAFGARAPLDRARCLVAEAEVRLAMRDLGRRPASLDALARRLGRMGDAANARQARLVAARWALLTGRLTEARGALGAVDLDGASPTVVALSHLGRAEIAMREIPRAGCGTRAGRRAPGSGVVGCRRADRRDRAGQSRAGPTVRATRPARHLDGRCAGGRRRGPGVERAGRGRYPPDGAGRARLRGAVSAAGVVRAGARPGRGVA